VSPAWQDAAGWALIHSVWQGALAALLLAAALRWMPRASSGVRYAASCVALGLALAAPLATFAARAPVPGAEVAGVGAAGEVGPPGWSAVGVALGAGGAAGAAPEVARAVEPAVRWIVWAWAAGVAVLSLRLLGGWVRVHRLARGARLPAPAAWKAALERHRARLGIRRPVALFLSARVSGPALVGWLRPVVLMPLSASSGLTERQVELLLLHELVHVRRWDVLVNLLQRLAEVVLFFHPAVWWISARIAEEREHCCDDAVVARSGVREYVLALLALEEGRTPALALGAGGASLLARVRRLADPAGTVPRRRLSPGVPGVALVAAVLAALPAGAAARTDAAPAGCAAGGSTLCPALGAEVRTLLREAGVPGSAVVQDVGTGAVLVLAEAGGTPLTEPVLPASLWKLAVAAVWWERGWGSEEGACPASLRVGAATVRNGGRSPARMVLPEGMLVHSCNTAAVAMVQRLGRDGGAARLARELGALGFPVAGAAPAGEFWASTSPAFRARMAPGAAAVPVGGAPEELAALALATSSVRLSPLHLSRFLQAVGNDGVMRAPTVEAALAGRGPGTQVMSPGTAARLRGAMLRTVEAGTARAAAGSQPGGWRLGGKTGTLRTGPAPRPDGWFAGLVVDPSGRARYTVLVHLEGGGPGGEAPTRMAARIARTLALHGPI
jgi:beta-lactamase regulating signal transducer with metallopeptidase domain